MAAVIATIAVALAPMLDEAIAEDHHHHRHHAAQHADPPPPAWQTATASYYNVGVGQATACGSDVPMGVANRSLPCGTRVRMCVTRCAVAIVDDRGPYVYDRLWDLSPALAAAIGFSFGLGVMPVRWALV